MQSQVVQHASTEEFVSVTTVTSFSMEETSPLPGKILDDVMPQDADILADAEAAVEAEVSLQQAKQVNGKARKDKRSRARAGPKSKKARAAAKKKIPDQPDTDEQSLDLQLDDDVSEMNESLECIHDTESEAAYNGTNGHAVDDIEKDDQVNGTDKDAIDEIEKDEQDICGHYIGEHDVDKEDGDKVIERAEVNNEAAVVCEDEIEGEMEEDYEEEVDEEDRTLADLVADHKKSHPLQSEQANQPLHDVTPAVEPQSSREGELPEAVLKAPFVRYLSSVSARRPLHATPTPAPASPRSLLSFLGIASKQYYAVNATPPPCASLAQGKRKADSPVEVMEERTKKLKTEDVGKSPGFFSMFSWFRSSSTPLLPEGREVGDQQGEGEEVVGEEEMPVLQNADETSKRCSVM